MKDSTGTLGTLAWFFALMSLFAIGGANSAVPEIHRFAVDVQHWMTDPQFSDIFGLAQLTPGPNVIVVTLIGYHVAGLAGALVATLAMCGPTCLLAFYVGRTFDRFRGASWQVALAGGLVPVTLGLTAASAVVVARAADDTRVAVGITVATALITYWIRVNPLWIFAVAALLGLSGLV
jgi:chromate transporter